MDVSLLQIIVACFVIVLPVLWHFSQSFRYYCRFVLYSTWVTLSSFIFIPIFMFRPKDIRNMGIARDWFKKSLWVFGVKWEVRDSQNIYYDKPCIIVCNHQSIIDMIGMVEVIPCRTTAIAKKELIYTGSFGIAALLGGMIFVDRSNQNKAHETMGSAAKVMVENNFKVWVFPEGTRNAGSELLPFKKGAFHLAIQAQVPIFPVVFSSYRSFMSAKEKKFNSGNAIITCLPRVETAGLTAESVNSLAEKVRNSMNSVFLKTSEEISKKAAGSSPKSCEQKRREQTTKSGL